VVLFRILHPNFGELLISEHESDPSSRDMVVRRDVAKISESSLFGGGVSRPGLLR
jgi:hypothetical protein